MNLLWVTFLSLLLITFFAGIEIAFANSNKIRIELDIKYGGFNSQILQLFLKNTVLFGITILIGYYLSVIVFSISITMWLQSWANANLIYPIWFSLIEILIASLMVIVVAELFARTVIRFSPNRVLNTFCILILIFYIIFYPIAWLLFQTTKGIRKLLFRDKNQSNPSVLALATYDKWLMESRSNPEHEHKHNQEIKIFQKALAFSQVRIRDCMIPRTEIEAIDINAGIEALRKKFIATGYSKILVYRSSVDNIIGYINSKELFKHPSAIKEKLNQISFFPETMPASKLLHEFMQFHRSVAVVVDEYGGISGIVTLEDIMEEIFGEIEDEHDTDDMVERRIKNNELVLSCRLEIDYLNSKYNLNLPESEEYDTLAGLILFHHHNLPSPNDLIKIDTFTFKILKVSSTRIELVHLKVEEE
jgi:putative hemolysin